MPLYFIPASQGRDSFTATGWQPRPQPNTKRQLTSQLLRDTHMHGMDAPDACLQHRATPLTGGTRKRKPRFSRRSLGSEAIAVINKTQQFNWEVACVVLGSTSNNEEKSRKIYRQHFFLKKGRLCS